MQTTHRFYHAHSQVLFPLRVPQEGIPDVYEQARALNGEFTRISKGLPEGAVANFSPSIQKHKGKTYIAWRSQPEPFGFKYDNNYFYLNNAPTEIYIGILRDDDTIVGAKKLRSKPHRLSYEDPRLFVGPDDELYVQFVGSTYASRYNKGGKKLFDDPKIVVAYINEFCEATNAVVPPIGKNRKKGSPEKNWCFFSHKDELRCLYSTRPITIERENGKAIEIDSSILDEVTGGAPTFNSLPPINLGYAYLTFYHWKHTVCDRNGQHYLLYHLSAYLMDKTFTKVTHAVRKPLFSGSLNDQLISWTDYAGNPVSKQPAVILPFGAYTESTNLVMALGVNDAFMGIFRCPLEAVMREMQPVD